MKILPCGDHDAQLREGPYFLARWPSGRKTLRYSCALCKQVRHISKEQWNCLPHASPKELVDKKIVKWTNMDFPPEQLEYLKNSPLDLVDIVAYSKDLN